MKARIITAKIDGATYEIPEIWLVGRTTVMGRTYPEAIADWHQQAQLAAEFKAQRKAAA